MTLLVTGGLGYIGSHTALVLALQGHNLVLFDNLSNSDLGVLAKLKRLCGQDLAFIQGDVQDEAVLSHLFQDYQFDGVIHFAGLKAVGESVAYPLRYFENNLKGTITLLKVMNVNGVKTLVFSSSATVYGEPHYLPLDEAHPTSAVNPYGRTKHHIEELLTDVAESDQDWRIASLRYFNPVGAHESGLIGENPKGIPNNLMPYIAKVATGALPLVNVYGGDYPTKDGTGVRDYIHVQDLAEGHLTALEFLTGRRGWHSFNLGTGVGYSVLEIIQHFEAASGKTIPYQITDRRPGDVATCYANPAKANAELGWQAKRNLSQMCQSVWHFLETTRQAEVKAVG